MAKCAKCGGVKLTEWRCGWCGSWNNAKEKCVLDRLIERLYAWSLASALQADTTRGTRNPW